MKGPPWWCWWRAGANLVALQCDTHKSSSPTKRKPRWSSKSRQKEMKSFASLIFVFSLSCEADAFLSCHGSSWTSGQLSKRIFLPLCVEDEWNSLQLWSFEITTTYPFLSIFVWVLVHMMLGDYLWPILRLNWPIKNCTCRAKRLQDHSRQGLSVYHALGLVPMCDHHRIRELHHVNTCKLWSQADGIGRLCTLVQLITSSFSQIERWNRW